MSSSGRELDEHSQTAPRHDLRVGFLYKPTDPIRL